MTVNIEPGDEPLTICTKSNNKTIKVIVSVDKIDDEVSVRFFRSSIDLLQLEVVHPEVRIPASISVW